MIIGSQDMKVFFLKEQFNPIVANNNSVSGLQADILHSNKIVDFSIFFAYRDNLKAFLDIALLNFWFRE